MAESHHIAYDVDELVAEILLYLAVVELFRQEEREPTWRVDSIAPEVLR